MIGSSIGFNAQGLESARFSLLGVSGLRVSACGFLGVEVSDLGLGKNYPKLVEIFFAECWNCHCYVWWK